MMSQRRHQPSVTWKRFKEWSNFRYASNVPFLHGTLSAKHSNLLELLRKHVLIVIVTLQPDILSL